MNVSFTRARSKLIVFGSRKTLQAAPLLQQFFTLMDEKGWIFKLPIGADEIHRGEFVSALSSKRGTRSEDEDEDGDDDMDGGERSAKRRCRVSIAEDAILKGRHILHDLVNGEK